MIALFLFKLKPFNILENKFPSLQEHILSGFRSCFSGRRCTDRCKNSISILQRQKKAEKLKECECEENDKIDEFRCDDVKKFMGELCAEKPLAKNETEIADPAENEVDVDQKVVKNSAENWHKLTFLWAILSICLCLVI